MFEGDGLGDKLKLDAYVRDHILGAGARSP